MANKRPKASLTAEKQFAVKYPDLDTQNPSQGKEQKGFSEIGIQRLSSLVDRDTGKRRPGAVQGSGTVETGHPVQRGVSTSGDVSRLP